MVFQPEHGFHYCTANRLVILQSVICTEGHELSDQTLWWHFPIDQGQVERRGTRAGNDCHSVWGGHDQFCPGWLLDKYDFATHWGMEQDNGCVSTQKGFSVCLWPRSPVMAFLIHVTVLKGVPMWGCLLGVWQLTLSPIRQWHWLVLWSQHICVVSNNNAPWLVWPYLTFKLAPRI